MNNKIRSYVLPLVSAGMLASGAAWSPARAGLIATDQAVQVQSERNRVKALVARPEVARRLETLGVLPQHAQARVDALTDEEVRVLAGRIDALPAGAMSDQNWLLVIVIILLLIIIL